MAGFESLKVTAEELEAGLPGDQQQADSSVPVVPGTENDPQFQDGDNPAESAEAPSPYVPGQETEAPKNNEPAEPIKNEGQPDSPVAVHQPSVETPEAAVPETPKAEGAQKDALQKFLEDNGLASEDELKERLAASGKKPESPEDVDKRNRVYRASVDKFAQDNGIITREEILALENMKAATPEDVVWPKFKEEWLVEHPDHDKATVDEDARLDFEAQYHLNSENKILRQKGEKMLQRDREEIVGPLEQKYADAETQYNERNTQQDQIVGFAGLLKSAIEGAPKQIEFGEGDDKIVYQLDGKLDVKELDEFLTRQDLWEKYLNKEDIKDELNELVEFFVWKKNNKEIANVIRNSGYSAGLKEGSKVGASAPFHKSSITPESQPNSNDLTAEDRERARRAFSGR